jgi:hypothetical protein
VESGVSEDSNRCKGMRTDIILPSALPRGRPPLGINNNSALNSDMVVKGHLPEGDMATWTSQARASAVVPRWEGREPRWVSSRSISDMRVGAVRLQAVGVIEGA